MQMLKSLKAILPLFALMVGLGACDRVEPPFTNNNNNGGGGGTTTERKVLVEEFTGFTCKNCPIASKLLGQLAENNFEDKVVVVAIHAGDLAEPDPPKYPEEYRVLPGCNQLYNEFQMQYVPVALINRVPSNSAPYYEKEEWATALTAQTALDPEASMSILTNYNAANREVSITVNGKYLVDGSDNELLNVYLIEDHVVGKQDSMGIELEEYHHRHMLRAFVNGKDGEKIKDGLVAKDETFTKTYTYTVPTKVNIDNAHVVAFVRNGTTKVVRQAEEKHVLQ